MTQAQADNSGQRCPDGWTIVSLGALGATYGGLVGKTKEDFGVGSARYVPFLNIMNNVVIDPEDFDAVRVTPSERQNRVAKGDILFNGSSETPNEVGMCAFFGHEDSNVYLNSFCFGFRLHSRERACGLYLAYYFRSGAGRSLLRHLAQGAIRYNLSKRSLLKLEFALPPLAEQVEIASVLSNIDAEVAALEARRDKTLLLKQGIMQELLTGRIRLV